MKKCLCAQQTLFAVFCTVTLNFVTASCTTPSSQFDQQAEKLGFHVKEYQGTAFIHRVYANHQPLDHNLHIYLGSDGTPWKNPEQIAADPTPRNPVMLRMMALDPDASVYIGRPCYHGFSHSPRCHPRWWTSARYSKLVVESLASVLTQIADEYSTNNKVLFGYSGGGTLAMLLAEQVSSVHGILTVAGNLDIEAWATYHSYSPLSESINPASRSPLDAKIFQFHILGGRDEVIPPNLVQSTIAHMEGTQRVVFKNADHQCCWESYWPEILRQFKGRLHNLAENEKRQSVPGGYSRFK